MNAYQKACEAVLHWDEYCGRHGGDRKSSRSDTIKGDTVEVLASLFKVNKNYIQQMRNLFLSDPERFEEVRTTGIYRKEPERFVLYAMGSGLSPTKVGRTNTLASRLSGVQTGNATALQVIATIEVNSLKELIDLETEAHAMVPHCRLEGEWFDLDAFEVCELFDYLDSLERGN